MEEEYSMYQEDFEADERDRINSYEDEKELSRQSRQIVYEAAARQGFPLGPLPQVI